MLMNDRVRQTSPSTQSRIIVWDRATRDDDGPQPRQFDTTIYDSISRAWVFHGTIRFNMPSRTISV